MKSRTPTTPIGAADVEHAAFAMAARSPRRVILREDDTQPDMRAIPIGAKPRTAPDLRAVDVPRLPPWALRGVPESESTLAGMARLAAHVVEQLEELVRTQIASANYLLAASRAASSAPLAAILEGAAEQRRARASVLRSIIALNELPEPGTDAGADAISLMQQLAPDTFSTADARLVSLIAQQERAVLRSLEIALVTTEGTPVRDTVQAQLVEAGDQLRGLEQLVRPQP